MSEFKADVKPGVFELSTAMTAEEMMEAMTVTEEEESGEGTKDTTAESTEAAGNGAGDTEK